MAQVVQSGTPILLSATGTVSKVSGTLLGFYVASTTGGTVVVRVGADGASTGTAVTGTITPAAGAWHELNMYCPAGCHITIANTLNATFMFAAG